MRDSRTMRPDRQDADPVSEAPAPQIGERPCLVSNLASGLRSTYAIAPLGDSTALFAGLLARLADSERALTGSDRGSR